MYIVGSGEVLGSRGSKEIRDGKDLFGYFLLFIVVGVFRSFLFILKCFLDDYIYFFFFKCFVGGWSFFLEFIVFEYTYRRYKEKLGER